MTVLPNENTILSECVERIALGSSRLALIKPKL